MRFCMLVNYKACIATWDELSVSADEVPARRQADGFLKMWERDGIQYRLTSLMTDLLHHLSCLQKEFQRADLLLFDVHEIQDRYIYIHRIAIMKAKPYPGGAEENCCLLTDGSVEDSDCEIPLAQQPEKYTIDLRRLLLDRS